MENREIVINTEFGKIGLNKEKKEAYFFVWDYIAPIGDDGLFKGLCGELFRVSWGIGKLGAVIEWNSWKEIGRAG